jgi:hypothetical protein
MARSKNSGQPSSTGTRALGAWRFSALICAVVLVAGAQAVRAGVNVWTTHGPYGYDGSEVVSLAIDPQTPSTLYAGGGSGVRLSTDDGATWSAINTGFPDNAFVRSLAIDPHTPSTLYAFYAGTDSGVFKSTDSGASWSAVINNGHRISANALAIDPVTPSTLYAGGWGGVVQSTDSGASWTTVNTGLPGFVTTVTTLAIDPVMPSTLYAGLFQCGAGCGAPVYRSTNSGASWTATGLTDTAIATVTVLVIDPSTPSTLYAGYNNVRDNFTRVYRSTDSGATWAAVNLGLPGYNFYVTALVIDPVTPSTLYAGGNNGVVQSTNSGGSWTAVNTGLNDTTVQALAINPHRPSTLYAGTYQSGVFKTTNSGASWSAVNTGFTDLGGGALAIDPHTPSTLYTGTGNGVFRSTNSGGAWNITNFPGVPIFDPHTPSTLYAGVCALDTWEAGACLGGVFKSTDSGASWTTINTGLPDRGVSALVIDPVTPSTLYVGVLPQCTPVPFDGQVCSGAAVFKSTDSGANWEAADAGLPVNESGVSTSVTLLAIDPVMPSTLYAQIMSCGPNCGEAVYQSTNSGSSWTLLSDLGYVEALAVDPIAPSTLYAGTSPGGVFRSTDGGASWSAVNDGLPDLHVTTLVIDPHTPNTLYAGTWQSGVFQSTNSGGSWTALNPGLTDLGVDALAVDPITPSTLYAGTRSGRVFDIELTCVVGTGTSVSCTEAALDACLPGGSAFTGAVTFDCGASPATITATSTKTISADTTIDGGSLITISGGNSVGVFSVNSSVKFTVQNLTISNGHQVQSSTGGGGAIGNAGSLTVANCTFFANSADCAGGVCNNYVVLGGAIYNLGSLTVTNSTFSGNTAPNDGGISNDGGGTLVVTNSTFSSNSANLGRAGAIGNNGSITITNSTFSSNSAAGSGGAIGNAGSLTVTNSTLSGNSASDGGGAIWNGIFPPDGSPFPCVVTGTIITNDSSGNNCGGMITDGGHNLEDGTTCGFTTANGSLSNTDPKLDPTGLKNNGGPTQTIALEAGSPAINAGDESVCAAAPVNGVDQRGYERPGTGYTNCSIGAYEYNSPGPPPMACAGDCDATGGVTVDEIVTLVSIALGEAQPSACPHGIPNGTEVDIALIIQAVNNALNEGCS